VNVLEIVPYDTKWPNVFSAERDRIAAVLGALALRIDHHGSTSVPGLAAKPIIDIQVSVERLHPIETYAPRFAQLGYVHLPHPDDAFCPFFHRPAAWPHTHHVHVVEAGGDEERRTLAFRDYLRDHSETAREYADLKRWLAPQYSATELSSHQAYADAKTAFITRVNARARAEGIITIILETRVARDLFPQLQHRLENVLELFRFLQSTLRDEFPCLLPQGAIRLFQVTPHLNERFLFSPEINGQRTSQFLVLLS
jgi:GrpB-like predicted nucleotidyltransferase (UPF0157 family)